MVGLYFSDFFKNLPYLQRIFSWGGGGGVFEGRVKVFYILPSAFLFSCISTFWMHPWTSKAANIYEGSMPSLLFVHWANDLPIELN